MNNLPYDDLVNLITKEVIKRMTGTSTLPTEVKNALPAALLAGDEALLPEFAKNSFHFVPIDKYNGDITPYKAVFIASIKKTELVDCALGRDSSPLPCAVSNALLSGRDVFLLEEGLPHKKFGRTDKNRNFYNLYDGYVNTVKTYGVKLIKEQWQGANFERSAIEDNTADKLITEEIAEELCSKCASGVVKLRRGTVITPSAKDVFNYSDIKVEFV